ncbi:MAG: FkbM family methyltransferase [Xanthomonadales bacterium]|jgi:FkbM family methyltransferase|nr:FkbM family methyltransferase [Xanthomonadales bacterium]
MPDRDLSPAELKNLQYDREALEVMRRCLGRDSLGIDGGAHEGDFLRQMLRVAPAGRHHAFEPLPHLAEQLERTFSEVRVHAVALGQAGGVATFTHVVNDPGYSGLRPRTYDRPNPELEQIEVRVVRLDDVLAPDDAPAFIKLDLEGGEYHALLGATETIRKHRPVVVFEAGEPSSRHYGVSPQMIHSLFRERFGYALTTMARWLAEEPPLDEAAFLAVYPEEFYFLGDPSGP